MQTSWNHGYRTQKTNTKQIFQHEQGPIIIENSNGNVMKLFDSPTLGQVITVDPWTDDENHPLLFTPLKMKILEVEHDGVSFFRFQNP